MPVWPFDFDRIVDRCMGRGPAAYAGPFAVVELGEIRGRTLQHCPLVYLTRLSLYVEPSGATGSRRCSCRSRHILSTRTYLVVTTAVFLNTTLSCQVQSHRRPPHPVTVLTTRLVWAVSAVSAL
jgi:hypothetical protein